MPRALAVDEAAHLRVPAARLVAEVDPGLQQLLDADLGRHVGAPFVFVMTGTAAARNVADPGPALAERPHRAGPSRGPRGSGEMGSSPVYASVASLLR